MVHLVCTELLLKLTLRLNGDMMDMKVRINREDEL